MNQQARGWAAPLAVLVLLLVPMDPQAGAARRKDFSAAELTNPFLSPKYARWLIGPLSRMASDQEIESFVVIRQDQDAASFISAFWRTRDPSPAAPGNKLRELFDERSGVADKQYSEAAHLGRHTDRGTIFILYGTPEEISYEEYRNVAEPDVELWRYPKRAAAGLDGKRPARQYRFARQGGLTTFYTPRRPDDSRFGRPQSPNSPSRFPPEPPL